MAADNSTNSKTDINRLVGQQFHNWLVIRFDHTRKRDHYWLCRCTCGSEIVVVETSLKSGKSRQCIKCGAENRKGCNHVRRKPEYQIWQSMIQRCENKKCNNYERYGARGIKVCERWRNSFEDFLADMGERPSKNHSIERKDNGGHYCPENCMWATRKQQLRNTRSNRLLTFHGKTQCVTEWAEELGLDRDLLLSRVRLGWDDERILTEPVNKTEKLLTYNGETKTQSEWARKFNIGITTLSNRLKQGWSVEKALTFPKRHKLLP